MFLKPYWKSSNTKFLYLIILIVIVFCLFILYPRSNEKFSHKYHLIDYPKIVKRNFLSCSNEAANKFYNEPTKFFEDFKYCIKTQIGIDKSQMDNFANDMMGEKKMFLPFSSDYQQSKCKWLTIGIGGVNAAEKLLKEKYPECEVFGAELLPKFYGNFSSVGTLIPHGVGLEDTEISMEVNENGTKVQKTYEIISLTHLLDKFVGTRFIHYLTIDIEGYEYLILEQLVNNGKFAKDGITFCQIDAELHFIKFEGVHPKAKNISAVEFINNFIGESSPYIPIFNIPYLNFPHQKVTFINVVNPECEKAFKFINYFTK